MEHDWPQILSAHGPAVWRTLMCMLGHDADARDCYQTVFLEAFQYASKETVHDWDKLLKRIARARGIDTLRRRYRTAARIDAAANLEDFAGQLTSPDRGPIATELADRLRRCIALLPPRQAEVFVMRFVEHLSYDEIAERTNSNRNAVGVMLARARTQLQQLFEEKTRNAIDCKGNRNA